MSVRLKFPRGGTFKCLRQFVRDGAPVDLTGKAPVGFLKNSSVDADADAIASTAAATLTVDLVNSTLGIVRLTIPAATTAALSNALRYFFQLRCDLGGGDVIAPEQCQGPVELTPFTDLNTIALPTTETLEPDGADELTTLAASNFVNVHAELISAALHRTFATVGRVLPFVILTLENGVWTSWTLRARAGGEVDDTDNFRVPADYNASTNNVIWVKSAFA